MNNSLFSRYGHPNDAREISSIYCSRFLTSFLDNLPMPSKYKSEKADNASSNRKGSLKGGDSECLRER